MRLDHSVGIFLPEVSVALFSVSTCSHFCPRILHPMDCQCIYITRLGVRILSIMKIQIKSVFWIITAVVLAQCACGLVSANDKATLSVGIVQNPPISYVGEGGEVSGLVVDVLNDVAAKAGWKLDYVTGTWPELVNKLEDGNLDIQTGIAYSEERAKKYDFNQLALVVNWGVLYRTSSSKFASTADLDGAKIAVFANTTHTKAFLKLLDDFGIRPVTIEVENYEQAFEILKRGEADFAVVSRLFGILNSGQYGVIETGMNFNPVEVRFVSSKGKNAEILRQIDVYLKEGKASTGSNYHRFLRKHLTGPNELKISSLVFWVAVFSISALILSIIAVWLLKREVNRRTRSLQENEAKLLDTQFISRIGDFDWDVHANLVSCSEGLNYLIGKNESPPLQLEDAVRRSLHADDRKAFKNWIDSGIKSGKEALDTHIFRLLHADGTVIHAETLVSIEYKDEAPVRIFGIFRDISERVQSEQALIKALESAVAANFAKSDFLATMSHELRTPLNAILGFTQLIQLQELNKESPLSSKHKSYIDSIETGGKHLQRLINDVLDVTQIESDRIKFSQEIIHINSIVHECVRQIWALAQNRGITIENQVQAGPGLYVLADSLRFKQVLINLLSNAINYNKDNGSIVVSVEQYRESTLCICIADSGVGIADRHKADVFKAFTRLEADPMLAREGTGIGLTISKLLVEGMGGKIGFVSEENVGSTFWFELPKSSPEAGSAPQDQP